MTERTIQWEGESGQKYKYWITEMDSTYKHVAGNYILTPCASLLIHQTDQIQRWST